MKSQSQTEPKQKKKALPIIIGVIVAIVLLAFAALTVAGVIVFSVVVKPKIEFQKQFEAGEKYVLEKDYEEALLAYKGALNIDPDREEVYLSIGDTYLALADQFYDTGDMEQAQKTLEKGIKELKTAFKRTGSDKISEKMEELEERKESLFGPKTPVNDDVANDDIVNDKEPISDIDPGNDNIQVEKRFEQIYVYDTPLGLEEFVGSWAWASREFKGETEAEINDIMDDLVTLSFFGRFEDYPGNIEIDEGDWIEKPRILDADGVDWMLRNIYNFDDSLIEEIKQDDFHEKYDEYYSPDYTRWRYDAESNTYQGMMGGVGDGPAPLIKRVMRKGDLYYVEAEIYWWYGDTGEYNTLYMLLENKKIDGKQYWSIHESSASSFMDFPSEPLPLNNSGTYIGDEELIDLVKQYYYRKDYYFDLDDDYYGYSIVEQDGNMVHIWVTAGSECSYTDENGKKVTYYMMYDRLWIDRSNGKGTSSCFGRVDLFNKEYANKHISSDEAVELLKNALADLPIYELEYMDHEYADDYMGYQMVHTVSEDNETVYLISWIAYRSSYGQALVFGNGDVILEKYPRFADYNYLFDFDITDFSVDDLINDPTYEKGGFGNED